MKIKDNETGEVFEYGTNMHHVLRISENGGCLTFVNLQNGDGSLKSGDGGYSFVLNDGKTPIESNPPDAINGATYANIGGFHRGSTKNDGWIPVEEYGLPKEEGVYDVTIIDGRGVYDSVRWQFLEGTHLSGHQYYVDGIHYWADNYRCDPINKFLSNRVIAWKKKPDPYRPERSNDEKE